jgi:hypothetical protein
MLMLSCVVSAGVQGRAAATKADVQTQVQGWLDSLSAAGKGYEADLTQGVPPMSSRRVANGLYDASQGEVRIGLGFTGPVEAGMNLEQLRASFKHVALDRIPVPGIQSPGWETRLLTPVSSFTEGVTLESWENGVLTVRVRTRFFAVNGTQTGLILPADAPMPLDSYFQIRQAVEADLRFSVQL